MTISGWIFLALGWGMAIGLSGFCYYLLLGKPNPGGDEEPRNPVAPTP